ncbi:MAG: hypothetical protein WCR29_03265 [Bacteroidales bacterium]
MSFPSEQVEDEIGEIVGLSIRGIEWNMKQLKKQGLIERIGPTKGGYWQVKEKI